MEQKKEIFFNYLYGVKSELEIEIEMKEDEEEEEIQDKAYGNSIGRQTMRRDAAELQKQLKLKFYNAQDEAYRGNNEALFQLGNMYFNGIGVTKNTADAVKYYKMAADQGSKEAQFQLGYMYFNGIHVTKNTAESDKYYQMAQTLKLGDQRGVLSTRA